MEEYKEDENKKEINTEEIENNNERNSTNKNEEAIEDQLELKMPYIQTTLLIYELINLEYETRGTNIKLIEKSGMRKDRYSSLAYNYYVQCELERDLRKPSTSLKKEDILEAYRKLNKKPTTY